MFRRLLVPIVGNAASSVAIGFAIDIALARGGEIAFCYALDRRFLGMGSTQYIDPSWLDMLRPDAEKVGNAALARAAQAGCPATLHIVEGLAEEVVLGLEPSYDLIVMGTRAVGGFAQAFDHSVTDAVLRGSTRPVLVVREGDTTPQTSPGTAVFKRLLVPVDGSPYSQGAIDVASVLAAEHDEQLLFVYALDRSRATAVSGAFAFESGGSFGVMQRFATELLAKAEAAASAAGATHVTSKLLDGEPIEAILRAIAEEHVDAVVMGTHGRHGLDRAMHGSVTEDIIRRSPVPVVALHGEPTASASTPPASR